MKIFFSALLLGTLMLVGCDNSSNEPATPADALRQAGDQAKQAADEAGKAADEAAKTAEELNQ